MIVLDPNSSETSSDKFWTVPLLLDVDPGEQVPVHAIPMCNTLAPLLRQRSILMCSALAASLADALAAALT